MTIETIPPSTPLLDALAPEGPPSTSPDAPATTPQARKKKTLRPFPASSFEDPLDFAREVFRLGGGQPIKRLTLFDQIGKSPESGASRQLIVNAGRYGLTKGGVQAESIELTAEGVAAVGDQTTPREQARARVKLAITDQEIFNALYEKFTGVKVPAKAVLIDAAKDLGIDEVYAAEAVDTLVVNLKFVGLIKTLSGADRIISEDMLLDDVPASADRSAARVEAMLGATAPASPTVVVAAPSGFDTTCFYISPIGSVDSEQRLHSDLFLGSLVEPALEEFRLKVIRADSIDKPGVITRQVIEHIMRSRLVIADLSFHNPNVFYELALRHSVKLPVVQIIRASDGLPFDVNQMRTIVIDTSSIYTLVPKIETLRAEITNQVRRALETDHVVDTPISTYFPNLKVTF